MSINPYKWIKGLYTEAAMVSYHGKASMVEAGELAPHLFGVADKAYSQLVSFLVRCAVEEEGCRSTRDGCPAKGCGSARL